MSYHKLGGLLDPINTFIGMAAATGSTVPTVDRGLTVAAQPTRAIMPVSTDKIISAELTRSRYVPPMKYSTNLDKGGMIDTGGGGGGGGLPGGDGGGGCPSGYSEVIGPDKLPHCCLSGKCCPGQHTVMALDPTAEAGVGCACAPGYSVYDAKLNDCVKAAGSGGMAIAAAGAAALALLFLRK